MVVGGGPDEAPAAHRAAGEVAAASARPESRPDPGAAAGNHRHDPRAQGAPASGDDKPVAFFNERCPRIKSVARPVNNGGQVNPEETGDGLQAIPRLPLVVRPVQRQDIELLTWPEQMRVILQGDEVAPQDRLRLAFEGGGG